MKTLTSAPNAPKPVGPYSLAVEAGGLVFVAGQIALHPESGTMVGNTIEAQTEQVLKNLEAVLLASGSSMDRIAMTTIFLADMKYGSVVNELYADAINTTTPPARQTIAVKELPLGALVEISAVAVAA